MTDKEGDPRRKTRQLAREIFGYALDFSGEPDSIEPPIEILSSLATPDSLPVALVTVVELPPRRPKEYEKFPPPKNAKLEGLFAEIELTDVNAAIGWPLRGGVTKDRYLERIGIWKPLGFDSGADARKAFTEAWTTGVVQPFQKRDRRGGVIDRTGMFAFHAASWVKSRYTIASESPYNLVMIARRELGEGHPIAGRFDVKGAYRSDLQAHAENLLFGKAT